MNGRLKECLLLQDFRNKHLWRPVKSLETLQPYANPRISYPGIVSNFVSMHTMQLINLLDNTIYILSCFDVLPRNHI